MNQHDTRTYDTAQGCTVRVTRELNEHAELTETIELSADDFRERFLRHLAALQEPAEDRGHEMVLG